MDSSVLVRLFGFRAMLVHGDFLVLDRWLWLRKRLPRTANGEMLIDVGCGTGAFTTGAALRGYVALGLSWDERNQRVAAERARICRAPSATFEVLDVRHLHTRPDLAGRFDVAVCLETIEHVLDDRKLMIDIAACLKPGARLLLSTPYFHYRAITASDEGPFSHVEDGWHVRRGYTEGMLRELCESAGLICEATSFCSGFVSQKATFLLRKLSSVSLLLGWGLTLPLRPLPPLLDRAIAALSRWPHYSICLEAYKPRFAPRGDG
jgi:SAM-dependent methyltransferase